ncbi:hypothetical protein Anas_05383 [Armadillidium nasatum]|uniref:Uncharacterized protein n=1 Tax=Armadillidium nasatum TaxID=96803 RepID=A0A5N5SK87_9CRUS|nr:hypothetical protein Anas_05383 [Armadillidium nasatum]
MKEKKSESFSLFRKGSTRYSFTSQKKKSEEQKQVQIQRLSWSCSPHSKVTVPEDRQSKPCEEISSRLSRSSENLKKQNKSFNSLCKSRSSSFFKSSSSSAIRNIFTIGSSSSASTSSSNSSVTSSPKIRQSWSSDVTNILEKAETEVNDHTWEPPLREHGDLSPKINKPFNNYTKCGFPVSSLMEEESECEVMSTPKIICAHKKTPDINRKQIWKELQYIKQLGMLPEEIEPNISDNNSSTKELNPNAYEAFNLNSFKGYKTLPETQLSSKETSRNKETIVNELLVSSGQDEQDNEASSHQETVFPKRYQTDNQSCGSSSYSLSSGNSSSTVLDENQLPALSDTNISVVTSPSPHYDSGVDSVGKETFESQANSDPDVVNSYNNSSLSSILIGSEDDEDSETMTDSDCEVRSCNFETRLEDDLEKLTERKNLLDSHRDSVISAYLSDEEETVVQLRRKSRPNLYIDVEKARSQNLLTRLRLSTKSNPTHIEWINGLNNKSDARQLAEVMSPEVVENSEGVFHLQEPEGGKELTQQQREKNMTKALNWIRDELTKMKEQDQTIARQLVQLQLEMQRLRLHKSCIQHEALLEEVTHNSSIFGYLVLIMIITDILFRLRLFWKSGADHD